MITLYDNAFSPFARKVRIALVWKGIEHEVVDGLALENRDKLAAVNGRVEVPVIDHDGIVVVGSADIVGYLSGSGRIGRCIRRITPGGRTRGRGSAAPTRSSIRS